MLNLLAKELMILRAFCVLIALSMGIISPVLANAAQTNTEFAASTYSLPDGSRPVICFGNGNDGQETTHHCDECLFSGTPIGKHPVLENISVPPAYKMRQGRVAVIVLPIPDFLKRHQSRAPPLV